MEPVYHIPITYARVNSKPGRKEPNIYSEDEILKMMGIKNVKDRAIIFLDLQAGLRKGELASRKWKHIDFERDQIRITLDKDFTPKDKDNRMIPLRNETREALLEWRKISKHNKPEDYIASTNSSKKDRHFERVVSAILAKIGVGGHCKKFRDTFASYSLACGVPLQNVRDWMGHSDATITDYYSSYVPEIKNEAVKKIFEWGVKTVR